MLLSNTPISFTPNTLYIILSDIGSDRQFHWEFYLHKSPPHDGHQMHLVNNADTNHEWEYVSRATPAGTIPKDITLLVALEIASMDPVLHNALDERLARVSIEGPVTRRVWMKRALRELDEEGFICLSGKVDEIELEAETYAVENVARGVRSVERSAFGILG
ncbi:hypothetical protein BDW74DRAFT_32198 [Aspergillus multicolor]|uniref:uncharacterized protein n=1 Tax=Aspergillus multicolor TaxID=41759 RepID=UPI003CCDEEF5